MSDGTAGRDRTRCSAGRADALPISKAIRSALCGIGAHDLSLAHRRTTSAPDTIAPSFPDLHQLVSWKFQASYRLTNRHLPSDTK